MLVAAVLAMSLSLPPECPFLTRAEAESILGGAVQTAAVEPPVSMMPGTTITTCTFTGATRTVVAMLFAAKSAAVFQSIYAKQRADDAAAKKQAVEDSIQRAKDHEEMGPADGEKPTAEELEESFPMRIQEYETIGGVQARFYSEPHNGSVEYGGTKGARGLTVTLQWRGKPSEATAYRAKLRPVFASALQRL